MEIYNTMSLNVSIITGNLGQDPVLRTSNSGAPVCNLSIAVDRSYQKTNPDGTKTRVDTVDWIAVTCWGNLAETCHTWLKQGSLIAVTGSIRPRKYAMADGKNVNTLEVRAHNIDFMANIRSQTEVDTRAAAAATATQSTTQASA